MENRVGWWERFLKINALIVFILSALTFKALAQDGKSRQQVVIDTIAFGDNSRHWYGIYDRSNIINPMPGRPRYKATEIAKIADNILLYQKSNGGWPKNYDVMAILTGSQKDSLKKA